MAFGLKRQELLQWKRDIDRGKVAFITHYWLDERFDEMKTVTKVGAKDLGKLYDWGRQYGLKKDWIHMREDGYSHYDLIGSVQVEILKAEGMQEQMDRFNIK
ncbi:hypothetical protein KP77_19700 [Jeotgalibacillus alimentarius]|uniref:YneQ n=1 Tax=Jeotgalibacillus alimentarius TaxID=135826 RepID=A0A0C2S423_9BACL|nr:hypothetical protein [Jeotgalibacillus alimentarius]KIL48759.1 hypothetical protein KP77_19700 [Jeotgalibacillus alimentarius]